MAKRTAVAVTIRDEDIAYARRRDRYNCAIVRAIQRQLPEATHVSADAETIRFTLRYGGSDDYRYIFKTPAEVVRGIIQPFDSGAVIEPVSFTLNEAIDAREPTHRTPQQAAQHRRIERERIRTNRARNRIPQPSHERNRFVIQPDDPQETLNELRENLRNRGQS